MSGIKLLKSVKNTTILQNTLLRGSVSQIRNASNLPKDVKTHTGQQFAKDDYRMVRFINYPKHVNQQFAVDLIAEVPPKKVSKRVVWCDGGHDKTGHPRVYINLDKPGNHTCGYCGLRFVLEEKHKH